MAGLFTETKRKITKIIRKIVPPQQRICRACKRTLQKAIDECVKEQKGCQPEHCDFKAEIQQAILESKTPEVKSWSVDKTQILESENITLSWEVLYAKKVTISGLGEVLSKDNRILSPRQNTTYTLTVQDYKNNETEHSISVTVIPLPVIEIEADKTRIEVGDNVVLKWTATNVSKIILSFDNQEIDVANLTEFTVQPNEHTIYKLIATALDNHTPKEEEISVEVFPKPKIEYFKVTPDVALNSMPVTLSWKVKNAKRIVINGIGEVAAEGEKIDLYRENTLYTITAFGELSNASEKTVVWVFPTPIIESLLVPMPDFESRISLNPIKIDAPTIDVSINMSEIKMPDFNLAVPEFNLTLPELNLTPPKLVEPSDKFKEMLKTKYKFKISIFNFSKIYEYVRRKF